jgi:hypothetical protein
MVFTFSKGYSIEFCMTFTNSTLLTADMILLCTKTLYPIHGSHSPFNQNVYSLAGAVPLPSHLTSCTPTKSNLYLDSSLDTVIMEPLLHKLLMFHVPNLITYAVYPKYRPSPRLSDTLRNKLIFYDEGLLIARSHPKLEDHALSSVRGCIISEFTAIPHMWRPSLHPQPDDAPC